MIRRYYALIYNPNMRHYVLRKLKKKEIKERVFKYDNTNYVIDLNHTYNFNWRHKILIYVEGHSSPVKTDNIKTEFKYKDLTEIIEALFIQRLGRNLFKAKTYEIKNVIPYILLGLFAGVVIGMLIGKILFAQPPQISPIQPLQPVTQMKSIISLVIGK